MTYTMPSEIKEIEIQSKTDDQWEPIIDINENQSSAFPKGVFPEWLETFVDQVADSMQSPRDMSCMLAIGVLSTALLRKYEVQLDATWRISLNTYSVLLAEPSERKTPTFKPFHFPILNYEKELHEMFKEDRAKRDAKRESLHAQFSAKKNMLKKATESGDNVLIDTHEKDLLDIKKQIEKNPALKKPYLTIGDVTPEEFSSILADNSESVTIASSESTFFSDFGGAYSNGASVRQESILAAYGGDPIKVNRKKDREQGQDGISLDEPLANVSVMVQPAVLQKIPADLKSRGLLDRFFYFKPKSLVGYRSNDNEPIDGEVRNRYNKNIYKMLDMKKENKTLVLSEEARSIFKSFRDNIEEDLREGGTLDPVSGWGGKLAGNIGKLVGLLHVAEYVEEDYIPKVVESGTVMRAIDLTAYFTSHAKSSFDIVGIDEVDKITRKIVDLLKNNESLKGKEKISVRDIKQKLTGRGSAHDELKEQAIRVLEKQNYFKFALEGRRKMVKVNPEFIEKYAE